MKVNYVKEVSPAVPKGCQVGRPSPPLNPIIIKFIENDTHRLQLFIQRFLNDKDNL